MIEFSENIIFFGSTSGVLINIPMINILTTATPHPNKAKKVVAIFLIRLLFLFFLSLIYLLLPPILSFNMGF